MVKASFIIFSVIECLLYFFHLSVLILLVGKRKIVFSGAFYNILRVIFVADLISFITLAIVQKVSLIPFLVETFQASELIPSYDFNLSSYVTVLQFLGHTLIAFNRFTLIWFPLKQESIWKFQWYTVALICLPLLTICWKIHEPAKFYYLPDDAVILKFLSPTVTSISFILSCSIYIATTLIAAILNILTFIKIVFYQQVSTNLNVNERNLLSVSFIGFVSQFARSLYPITQLLFPNDNNLISFFQSILPFLNDIFALSGSVTLLFISGTTRKEYLAFYSCQMLFKQASSVRIFPSKT